MEFFLNFVDMLLNNALLTAVTIVLIGCVWIYFQIPNIKAKTAPPNGVVSSRDEWIEAKKATNIYSVILVLISLGLCYFVSTIKTGSILDIFVYIAKPLALISFVTALGMQAMNIFAAKKHINN
jgi:hypothetical protein